MKKEYFKKIKKLKNSQTMSLKKSNFKSLESSSQKPNNFLKLFIIVFILMSVLFSSCSIGGIFNGSSKKVPTVGYGLEVDFKIYDKDNLLKNKHQVMYDLNLKNTGLESIEINKDSLILSTLQVSGQSGNLEDVFTSDSLNSFYDKILDDSSLILYNNQEKKISGILKIKEDYYNNINNQKIDYSLDISYNYKTVFENNLEINYNNGINKLIVSDKVSQAAPIQIERIELIPALEDNKYFLQYFFKDKGRTSSEYPAVIIEDLQIIFRNNNIENNCIPIYEKTGKKTQDFIIRKEDPLMLECAIEISEEDTFNTKTFGEFSYIYKIKIKDSINLPKEK
ncbi:MAG: hypothetical protein ACOC16_02530 [Nanoarchaeota archaeon]